MSDIHKELKKEAKEIRKQRDLFYAEVRKAEKRLKKTLGVTVSITRDSCLDGATRFIVYKNPRKPDQVDVDADTT